MTQGLSYTVLCLCPTNLLASREGKEKKEKGGRKEGKREEEGKGSNRDCDDTATSH